MYIFKFSQKNQALICTIQKFINCIFRKCYKFYAQNILHNLYLAVRINDRPYRIMRDRRPNNGHFFKSV